MGKPRPTRGVPPSRRSGSAARNLGGIPGAEPIKLPAASEIAARLQSLAHQIDELPAELARAVHDEEARHGSSRTTGAEVIDAGLLSKGSKPHAQNVVTIDAYPNPEHPGSIAVRLDGWEGFLLLNLTKDRAQLLANRLNDAIERAKDWYEGQS